MVMNKGTRTLTLSALFTALSLIMLYIASVWPTGQLGLVAVASLFIAAVVVESGPGSGLSVFVAVSGLGMLIIPNKTAPLLFLMFFGYYPVVKSLIERIGAMPLQWLLKLLVFNASLTAIRFLLKSIVFEFGGYKPGVFLLYLLGNVVFAVFDYGFSKVIWLYISRVSKFNRAKR